MLHFTIDLVIRLTLITSLLFTALPPAVASANSLKIQNQQNTADIEVPQPTPAATTSDPVPALSKQPPQSLELESFLSDPDGDDQPKNITAAITSTLYLPLVRNSDPDPSGNDDTFTSKVCLPLVIRNYSPPPLVSLEAQPLQGTAPLTVTFTNFSSSHFDNYRWAYGDGSIWTTTTNISGTNPALTHTHTYT
jgi:PKD repeat protein